MAPLHITSVVGVVGPPVLFIWLLPYSLTQSLNQWIFSLLNRLVCGNMAYYVAQEEYFNSRANKTVLSYFVLHTLWIVKDANDVEPVGFWYPPTKTSSNQLSTLLKNSATPLRNWCYYTNFKLLSSHGHVYKSSRIFCYFF